MDINWASLTDAFRAVVRAGRDHSLAAALIVAVALVLAIAAERVCDRLVFRWFPEASSAARTLTARLFRWGVLAAGVFAALQELGVDLSAFVTAATLLALAAGLALQKIVQSVISGVLLLAEREIAPGDVIRVEGELTRVKHIGLRTTTLTNRRNETLILPNFELATRLVRNLTHTDEVYWVEACVSVEYGTNARAAEAVLVDAARHVPGRVADHNPRVFLHDLGPHGLNWRVYVAVPNPWHTPDHTSALYHCLLEGLHQAQIRIPYPQLDLHVGDAPAVVVTPARSTP